MNESAGGGHVGVDGSEASGWCPSRTDKLLEDMLSPSLISLHPLRDQLMAQLCSNVIAARGQCFLRLVAMPAHQMTWRIRRTSADSATVDAECFSADDLRVWLTTNEKAVESDL